MHVCHTIVELDDEITVKPLDGNPVIGDLVIDFIRSIRTPYGAFQIQKGAFLRRIAKK